MTDDETTRKTGEDPEEPGAAAAVAEPSPAPEPAPEAPPAPEPAPEAPPAPAKREVIRETVVEYREPPKKGISRLKIVLGILGVVAIIAIVALFTLNVTLSNADIGRSYPYTTTYDVLFPDGERVNVANTQMMALTFEDEMIIDVDGKRSKIVVGEEKLISERKAIVSALGVRILDTNFQIYLKYLGMQGDKARFALTVKTSNQVPQQLVEQLLPPEIEARPA